MSYVVREHIHMHTHGFVSRRRFDRGRTLLVRHFYNVCHWVSTVQYTEQKWLRRLSIYWVLPEDDLASAVSQFNAICANSGPRSCRC